MKDYKVKVIMAFQDKEDNKMRLSYNEALTEKENEEKGAIFYCTEERYNFLSKNNAVKLIEIKTKKQEDKELMKELTEKTTKKVSKKEIELIKSAKYREPKTNKR